MTAPTRTIVMTPLRTITPALRNPKGHDLARIRVSLRVHGYADTVLLDSRTDRLIAGHGRLEALAAMRDDQETPPEGVEVDHELDDWRVPVVHGWASTSDAQADAYLVASNRLTEVGGWDQQALAAVLDDLASTPDDDLLAAAGFTTGEHADLLAQLSAPEPTPAPAAAPTLVDRFLVTPFDVIDARGGWWQQRKRAWLALGIRSELGRGADTDGGTTTSRVGGDYFLAAGQMNGTAAELATRVAAARTPHGPTAEGTGGLLIGSSGGNDPTFYAQKQAAEARLGHTLTTADFQRDHYRPSQQYEAGTSIFDPVLCELVYRWFTATGAQVLDPFAGGSVRGLVAGLLGRSYVGNDLAAPQIAANREQAHTMLTAGLLAAGSPAVPLIDDPHALTPVERHGDYWIKRDDLFGIGGSAGGKVRTCLRLASQPGVQGLITAGSRRSPQVNIVAAVGAHLGLPVRVHVPAAKESTPELRRAAEQGADVREHRPGYNTVIVARAREDAAESGWLEVPFGMECDDAVTLTAPQVANVPADCTRIVMPVGSGMSLAGVLRGLDDAGRGDVTVVGVTVGADPSDRLDTYAPGWRERVTLVPSGSDYHAPALVTVLDGVDLDPHYEAKCMPHLQPGDLLWVVGIRETARALATVDRPAPTWTSGDSAAWVQTLPPESADLVFTCPPYLWLERYSDDPGDLSTMTEAAFTATYRAIIAGAVAALRTDRYAVLVVGDVRDPRTGRLVDFRGLTIAACEAAGMRLLSAAVLVTMVGSLAVRAGRQFESSRILGRTHQDVLVFVKGSRTAAAKWCGQVDVDTDTLDAMADAARQTDVGAAS